MMVWMAKTVRTEMMVLMEKMVKTEMMVWMAKTVRTEMMVLMEKMEQMATPLR